jgi:YHS domain-containing protein
LDGGRTVFADETYLRKTLIDPTDVRVQVYPKIMPAYLAQLSDSEIDGLVQYIKSIAGETPPTDVAAVQPAGVAQAIDPVCKMAVSINDQTIYLDYKSTRYYFCCDSCRRLFLLAPEKFSTGGTK